MKALKSNLATLALVVVLGLVLVGVERCACDDSASTATTLKEKYVSAMLSSKWSETPLLLEASEHIYRTKPDAFWRFVDDVGQSKHFDDPNSINNKSYYDELLDKVSNYVSPMQFDLFKLMLSVRTYSPAIEMSRQLAQDASSSSKCLTFVYIHGQTSCKLDDVETLLESADLEKAPYLYQFDKRFDLEQKKDASLPTLVVILYAQIGTRDFAAFHERIVALAASKARHFNIDYVLRHNYAQRRGVKTVLSGFGVELDIKSTEYKARDDTKVNADSDGDSTTTGQKKKSAESAQESIQGFMFDRLKQTHPHLVGQLDDYRKHLLESGLELAPLHAWQIQDLSLQAAQRIVESAPSDALAVLEDLSQNYPTRARALSKLQVRNDLRKALKSQRSHFDSKLSMEAGAGMLYVNGIEVPIDTCDIFALNSLLRKEALLLESLHDIGLTTQQIKDLVYLESKAKSGNDYGIDIRDSSVQWLNDLESDKKYAYWSSYVQEILRPTYPGMMRPIAKNFYNLVLVLDPAKEESRALLKTVESFYLNEIPVRIGFVFVTSDADEVDGAKVASVAMFRAYNYIKQKSNSPAKALSFLTDVYAKLGKSGSSGSIGSSQVSAKLVIDEFKRKYPREKNLEDVFGVDSDYDEGRKLTMDYYKKIGVRRLPQLFVNGFALSESELEADMLEEAVINKIMTITPELQMAVYKGQIHDATDLIDYLMQKENIMPRLNPRILTADKRNYLIVNELDDESKAFLTDLKYLQTTSFNMLTLWLVCDPDTEKGRQMVYDAIEFVESRNARLAIIMQDSDETDANTIKHALAFALHSLGGKQALTFAKRLVKEKAFNELRANKKSVAELVEGGDIKAHDLTALASFDLSSTLSAHDTFLKTHTPFKSSSHVGLIANGWMLGPLDDDESFIDSDFKLLENFLTKTGLNGVKELLITWNRAAPIEALDNKALMITSILGRYSSSEKRTKLPVFTNGVVNVKPKRADEPFYDVVVILDPLTRAAQKISTVLRVLSETTNVNVHVYFNCKEKLSAPPLKSFYRYVLAGEMQFDAASGQLHKPIAFFHNMPQSPILTMNVHAPESWMVEAVYSPFDLDNICLKETEADGAYGQFELEHLIIEGHAYDVLNGQPPRGLQFILGTTSRPDLYDTIVMANLGYFQLKASPGAWILQLREGKSKDIYDVVSHENTDSESKRSATIRIFIDSFEAKVIKVKVSKKADKLNENLLDDKEAEKESAGSIWDSIASFTGTGGASADESKEKKDNVLNIFSVASGHLYERLLRIMMFTVLKNTKANVKFWFLKNYLSPQFTKFLPYYAKTYGFDYELVQYKWPRWLHHETDKQRIIWGYKILFLDVLFPLNVEKIIYVDADQIVKADLTELRDLDLKGAPYGYTPFCDSRKDMDGYRFWKSGYWSSHLGHRKYHISALYVVDLKKFRKIAAGDRLRGQYQGLSQDPNSLSNLDQDLPNNMIHQVNIFSLPQEWLYCDAWCSRDTLKRAKTIDLCNNPQTKEPKLEQAVRIVPEWKDYDNEIKNLMKKWQSEKEAMNATATADDDEDTSTTTPLSSSGDDRSDL